MTRLQSGPPCAASLCTGAANPRQPVAAGALGHARRVAAGLCPHRTRKGRARADNPFQACAAQCTHPVCHQRRHHDRYLLGGAIVVEQVFAIPGLGRLILGAIAERNYPLVQATILVITFTFVIVNFVVDLLYA